MNVTHDPTETLADMSLLTCVSVLRVASAWHSSALWAAPAWKWGLAIVPLYGAVTGVPAIEKVDLNNALGQSDRRNDWRQRCAFMAQPGL